MFAVLQVECGVLRHHQYRDEHHSVSLAQPVREHSKKCVAQLGVTHQPFSDSLSPRACLQKLWRAKLVKQKAAVVHTPHAATEAVPGGAAPIIIDQSGGFELVFDPAHLVHQRKVGNCLLCCGLVDARPADQQALPVTLSQAPPRFEEWKRAKTAAAQQAKQRRAAVEAKQARAVRKQQHKGRIAFDKFLAECDERDAAARQQSQQKRDEAAKEATEAAKRAEEKQVGLVI